MKPKLQEVIWNPSTLLDLLIEKWKQVKNVLKFDPWQSLPALTLRHLAEWVFPLPRDGIHK